MEEKTVQQFFLNKIKNSLLELGLPSMTEEKVMKVFQHAKIDHQKKTIEIKCINTFYIEHIILPQSRYIETISKEAFGQKYALFIISNKTISEKIKKDVFEKNSVSLKIQKNEVIKPQSNGLVLNTSVNIHKNQTKKEVDSKEAHSNEKNETIKKEPKNYSNELTFENFVVCNFNKEAYESSLYFIKNNGNQVNPLFIYSETGLGKTHLINAIANKIYSENSQAKIVITSCENFVNEIIHKGIKSGKIEEIRKKYKTCDFLLIDDIQYLENKTACQKEFNNIFNELYQNNKKIVLTSNKYPKDLKHIDERIINRLIQGISIHIEKPNSLDIEKILNFKSQKNNTNLPSDIISFISSQNISSVREIEGCFKEVYVQIKNQKGNTKTDDIIEALEKRFPKKEPVENAIDPNFFIKTICGYFNISQNELLGQSRLQKNVRARHIAMFLSKDLLQQKMTQIAKTFSKKDHTSVIHVLKKFKQASDSDETLKYDIQKIKNLLIK